MTRPELVLIGLGRCLACCLTSSRTHELSLILWWVIFTCVVFYLDSMSIDVNVLLNLDNELVHHGVDSVCLDIPLVYLESVLPRLQMVYPLDPWGPHAETLGVCPCGLGSGRRPSACHACVDTWPAGRSVPGEAPPPGARRARPEQPRPRPDMPPLRRQGVQLAVPHFCVRRVLRRPPWGDSVR